MILWLCKRDRSVKETEKVSLRSQTDFSLPQVPKVWNILPSAIKNSRTLREFSKKVK